MLHARLPGCFADSSVRVCDVPATAAARAAPARDPDGLEPAPTAPPPAATALWGHAGPVYAADLSDDGQALFTASGDGTVRLWSTELWANLVAYRRAPSVWLGWGQGWGLALTLDLTPSNLVAYRRAAPSQGDRPRRCCRACGSPGAVRSASG